MTDRRLVLLIAALVFSANWRWFYSIAKDHDWLAIAGFLVLAQIVAVWIEVSAAWTVWSERKERRQVS